MKNNNKRKIPAIGIIVLLMVLGFASITTGTDNLSKSDTEHIVLIEQCTATNCGFCQFVDAELPNLVGNYERVSLGHSTYSVGAGYNSDINDRVNELGMTSGFPKTYFDGNYQMVSGGWTGMIT